MVIEVNGQQEVTSLMDTLLQDMQHRAVKAFENKLKEQIKEVLSSRGIEHSNEDEFIAFCRARMIRIGYTDRPHYFEVYMDYVDENDKGYLMACYSTAVTVTYKGNTVTTTIGETF